MNIKSPRRALSCQQRRPASSKELPTLGMQLLQINAQPLREIQATWECAVHALRRIPFSWLCHRHQNFPGPQDLSISKSISFFTSSLINHQHRPTECLFEMSLPAQWLCIFVLKYLGYGPKRACVRILIAPLTAHTSCGFEQVATIQPEFFIYKMEIIMLFI